MCKPILGCLVPWVALVVVVMTMVVPTANAEEPSGVALPDDLPFPSQIREVKSATTANTVCVKFLVDGKLEGLRAQLETALTDHNWTVENLRVSEHEFLYGDATKGPRSIDINAVDSVLDRGLDCTFSVTDSSVEHCDPEAAANATAGEARQVLDTLRKTYRDAQSYHDHGAQHTKFFTSGLGGGHENTLRYTTAFERPDRFRFEYADESGRYIVHQSGDAIRTHWTLDDEEDQYDSLSEAVAGPTGVSGGTVRLAAELLGLLDESDVAHEMRDAILLPEEGCNGAPCYVVHGYDRSCQEYTLWISKDAHLLLQMRETTIFADMKTVTTTTIEPHLNTTVPDEALAFDKAGQLPIPERKLPPAVSLLERLLKWF